MRPFHPDSFEPPQWLEIGEVRVLVYVCVSVSVWVPVEATGSPSVPWSRSYRQLHSVGARSQIRVLCNKGIKCS